MFCRADVMGDHRTLYLVMIASLVTVRSATCNLSSTFASGVGKAQKNKNAWPKRDRWLNYVLYFALDERGAPSISLLRNVEQEIEHDECAQ
mmetsp:Transcript_2019/g.12928  ORF Transcript_2019/g.12928 Transcript_2019/m.12928 type:complete len:91 (+) Transcript_2019:4146-4418(+)